MQRREVTHASALTERYRHYEEGRAPPAWYTDKGCLDVWRALYSRQMILPFLATVPGSAWLTVGDGYYGADANFLFQYGRVATTASALSSDVLSIAQERGWIQAWSTEDAQALSFADQSFDYVLCMEALQHCADPDTALLEAVRVARQGVFVMNCIRREGRILDRFREFLRRRVMGRTNEGPESYQPTGGPLNRLDADRVDEVARRAGWRLYAVKPFNMLPLGRFWDRRATWGSLPYWLFQAGFKLSDLGSRLGLMTPSFSWFVLLRDPPGDPQVTRLRQAGFVFRD